MADSADPMRLPLLVADVGGTNTRLGLVDPGARAPRKLGRVRNEDFPDFTAALSAHLPAGTRIGAACLAIAGPVEEGRGSLTNGAWNFDAARLSAYLGGVEVRLLNDLAALGHSLGMLGSDQMETVKPGRAAEGQALVWGLGTGCNLCPVARGADRRPVIVSAEYGGSSLPAPVAELLRSELGSGATPFARTEDLFTGRGLQRLHAAGGGEGTAPEIAAAAAAGDARAGRTMEILARAAGLVCRDLIAQYLPLSGIALSGSVARALVFGPSRAAFLQALDETPMFYARFHEVPVRVITEDAAALWGCLSLMRGLSQ